MVFEDGGQANISPNCLLPYWSVASLPTKPCQTLSIHPNCNHSQFFFIHQLVHMDLESSSSSLNTYPYRSPPLKMGISCCLISPPLIRLVPNILLRHLKALSLPYCETKMKNELSITFFNGLITLKW